jgi:hypothetical protein
VAAVVPLGESVHVPAAGVKLPDAPPLENVTVPPGLVAPEAVVSVTVAVQTVGAPIVTGLGTHDNVAVVGRRLTVIVAAVVVELPA